MPSPKSGKAESPVPPAKAAEALEADVADPGAVAKLKAEQRASKKGKYGQVLAKPNKTAATEEEKAAKKSWIEIELVDEKGRPIPGEPYVVTLVDGTTTKSGSLDEKGFARIENIEPGTCKVSFPNLDKDAWTPASGGAKGGGKSGAAGGQSGGQKGGDDTVGGSGGKGGNKKGTPDKPSGPPSDAKGGGGKGGGGAKGGGDNSGGGGAKGGSGGGKTGGGTGPQFSGSGGTSAKDSSSPESKSPSGKTGAAEDDLRGKVPGIDEDDDNED
jgi:hypothetical protein